MKINQSALDPLGLPLNTTVVSGKCADAPLYVPEIRKVQGGQHGVLYVGDCKMAALHTRAYIAASHDHYLCPLSAVQMPAADLQTLLIPVWTGEQVLMPVHRAPETEADKPRHIANGFSFAVTLKAGDIEWQEQRLVVQSSPRRNKRRWTTVCKRRNRKSRRSTAAGAVATAAVDAILKCRDVAGLLTVEYHVETRTVRKRAYLMRPAREVTTETVTVRVIRNTTAYEETVRSLGWRRIRV